MQDKFRFVIERKGGREYFRLARVTFENDRPVSIAEFLPITIGYINDSDGGISIDELRDIITATLAPEYIIDPDTDLPPRDTVIRAEVEGASEAPL